MRKAILFPWRCTAAFAPARRAIAADPRPARTAPPGPRPDPSFAPMR